MKTNKSFTKRLKVTKNGKIMSRKAGQNHFNAKERRRKQLNKKRPLEVNFSNKSKSRFLIGTK
ncbi:MAG: 50S ribosomal protein L35 [Patescibacteria group bacterium]